MTDVVHNTNHLTEGLAKLTDMVKKPNVQGVLSACLREIQKAEDALYSVWYKLLFPNAEGDQLDQYGLLLKEGRKGRTDDQYRIGLMVRMRVLRSKGRISDIIDISRLAVGTANMSYIEPGAPVTFQVTKEGIDPDAIQQLKDALHLAKIPGARGLLDYTLSPPEKCFRWYHAGTSVGGRGMSTAHVDGLVFTNPFSGWSFDTGSTGTGGQADPGGGTAATKFAETAVNDVHTAYSYYTNSGINGTNTPHKGDSVIEFYAKYDGRQWLEMSFAYRWQVWFDVLNGVVGTKVVPGGGSGTIQSATMTDVGDGWWLCRVEHTGSNEVAYYSSFMRMHLADADNSIGPYMGNTSKAVLLWQIRIFGRDARMASGETL